MSMEIGRFSYGERLRRALARESIPTLSEVKALAGPMKQTDSGGMVPAHWPALADPDTDRDPMEAAKLARLVRDMDDTCAEIMSRPASGNLEVRALARRWQAIRKITQSNRPTGEQA